jgi:hypothetical protein
VEAAGGLPDHGEEVAARAAAGRLDDGEYGVGGDRRVDRVAAGLLTLGPETQSCGTDWTCKEEGLGGSTATLLTSLS